MQNEEFLTSESWDILQESFSVEPQQT